MMVMQRKMMKMEMLPKKGLHLIKVLKQETVTARVENTKKAL